MAAKAITNWLKAQAGEVKANATELYTMLLITVGVPSILYVYLDWRAALTAFVFTQIALGLLSIFLERK